MKHIKKIVVFIIALIFILFLFIYRSYNLKKLENNNLSLSWTSQEMICNDTYEPVCWKDWKTYSNECIATKINEVLIDHKWECKEVKGIIDENTWSGIWESNLWEVDNENVSTWTTEKEKEKEIIIEKPSKEYYNNLKSQCEGSSCCISSVESMEEAWYSEAEWWNCPSWYNLNMLKCETSYKWCEKDEWENTEINTATDTWSNQSTDWKKVLNYDNTSLNYWFSLPSNTYFSWYWARDWATHTVWISTSSWSLDFWNSQVKVYFYKWKIIDELADSTYWMYEDKKNNKTYLKLNNNSIVIEWSSENQNIINMIIKTIYAK